MDSNNSIHSTVQVPVDGGTVVPEAMDGDTTMDTMDAEADTVDTTMYPCHSIHSTVQVPVDGGAVVPEAMGGDTTMDTMDAGVAMDGDKTMYTMDAEADTVYTTMYPCHMWAGTRWSDTLKRVFQASQTR